MVLSDDQTMLRDSVDRFLADRYDFAARQRILRDGGFSSEMWARFAELGWLGACLPEDCGGYGGGAAEAAIFMEAFGRHLVLEPFVWTVIVGGQLLRALDRETGLPLLQRMVEGRLHVALATAERVSGHDLAKIKTTATLSGSGWVISGTKPLVMNGSYADCIFVTARTSGDGCDWEGVSLFMVARDTPGISFRDFRTHDGHAASAIVFNNAPVPATALVGNQGGGLSIVEEAMDHGIAALCAEAVGSAAHVLDATITHLKTREQYGAPLAQLQVLQHRIAEMFVATEQARAMAGYAIDALVLPARERARAISAAKVSVSGHVRFVTQQAVQLHGGMGISEELDIAHHLKRATVAAMTFGDDVGHLQRFIQLEDQADALMIAAQ